MSDTMTVGELLQANSGCTRLDAEVLLAHTLQCDRSWLYAHPDAQISGDQFSQFSELVTSRTEGMPVAYLTGTQEFWSLSFQVNTSVLVPRPETELLVELVLSFIKEKPNARILELGTGSGAISVALAKTRPDIDILATDISTDALAVAQENIKRHNCPNIRLQQSSWFDNISVQQFDVIVSNPPYIKHNDRHLVQIGVCKEPLLALVSGKDGLDAIRHIAQHASPYLGSGSGLFLEHGYDQGDAAARILDAYFSVTSCYKDMANKDRVSCAIA